MTTLEASAHHISDLARQYEQMRAESITPKESPRQRGSTLDLLRSKSFMDRSSSFDQGSKHNEPVVVAYFDKDGHATIDSDDNQPFEVNFNAATK